MSFFRLPEVDVVGRIGELILDDAKRWNGQQFHGRNLESTAEAPTCACQCHR